MDDENGLPLRTNAHFLCVLYKPANPELDAPAPALFSLDPADGMIDWYHDELVESFKNTAAWSKDGDPL